MATTFGGASPFPLYVVVLLVVSTLTVLTLPETTGKDLSLALNTGAAGRRLREMPVAGYPAEFNEFHSERIGIAASLGVIDARKVALRWKHANEDDG